MNGQNPRVDPRVRLAIVQWPDDAPRGAVSAFCAEQGISRKTFYAIRARARSEGPAAALEPHSTRPASSPTRIGQEMVLRALAVRSALESSGPGPRPHLGARQDALDGAGGPLARVPGADLPPQGRGPQRAPQAPPLGLAPVRLSGPQRLLAAGRHRVRPGRRAQGRHLPAPGRPLPPGGRLPGRSGGNQRRRDRRVRQGRRRPRRAAKAPDRQRRSPRAPADGDTPDAWWSTCGPSGSSPSPAGPTNPPPTGDNERFHQTLLRYLDKQPPAESIADLQARVDAFDHIYNTQRPHQGLPGRITPQQAWDATPVADPPRPDRVHDEPALTTRKPPARSRTPQRGERRSRIRANGTVSLGSIAFLVSRAHAGCDVEITWDPDTVVFATPDGQVLVQHTWPAPGVTYVSTHGPDPTNSRGGRGRKKTRLSPMS